MLLTIHNLPLNTRYTDVKSLINDKCGLTDIILDNLVSEGKGKKVTVGLASDDDGALVVRKLNGLYLNGQQLYIEDRRKKTGMHDQPYRSSVSLIHESRASEVSHPNNMTGAITSTNVPIDWNYSQAAAPYMAQIPSDQITGGPIILFLQMEPKRFISAKSALPRPQEDQTLLHLVDDCSLYSFPGGLKRLQHLSPAAEDWLNIQIDIKEINMESQSKDNAPNDMIFNQNIAYPSYGVPQTSRYVEPQPVVPAASDRGYSGFQGEDYAPGNMPRAQEPKTWGRSGPCREQSPDAFRQHDRKRNHSPERPAVSSKRTSRWGEQFSEAPMRRESSPPRQQWSQEMNQGPRPPYRQPEQFTRNQNQFQPREPNPDYQRTDPQWETQTRWDEPNPRPEREWGNGNNRNWEPSTDKMWDNGPDHPRRDEPRRWDNEPNPHWEGNSRMPVEEIRSEWLDRRPPEAFPMQLEYRPENGPENGRHGRESRPRHRDADDEARIVDNARIMMPRFNTDWPTEQSPLSLIVNRSHSSSSRYTIREDEAQRRDRPEENKARRRNDRRDVRPNSSRDRSGGERERPSRHVAKDYPASKRPEFDRRDAYNAPRHDKKPIFKQETHKRPVVKEQNKAPFKEDRRGPPPNPVAAHVEYKKPQTITSMINKDHSNRGQATALIAKTVLGVSSSTMAYVPDSPLKGFIFKQLKLCIRSRIDVMLGEELSIDMGEVIGRYRSKYPTSGDRALLKQIREKSTKEYNDREKPKKEEVQAREALGNPEVKKELQLKREPIDTVETQNNSENELPPDNKASTVLENEASSVPENETTGEVENEATGDVEKEATGEAENEATGDVEKEATGEAENEATRDIENEATGDVEDGANTVARPSSVPPCPQLPKTKPEKPLTEKQIIKQVKLQRKWEYDNQDVYKLDDIADKTLDDEMADLNNLFSEECTAPEDPEEDIICKRITNESLNEFNKAVRLYIKKRILNIPSGLAIRIFADHKLPRKTAVKEYLKAYRIERLTLKKNTKGSMLVANLSRFQDFDKLCKLERDVIDGIPVTFKAMNLVGPPTKLSRNQAKLMRQRAIQRQITEGLGAEASFAGDLDVGGFDEDELEDF